MAIHKELFGTLADGSTVEIYSLINGAGSTARIATYGGAVVSLETPDRNGRSGDVVLGYDDLASYVADSSYFGSLIGRCGNRIADGTFSLDGRSIQLAVNNKPNHLHGGVRGFDKVVWDAEADEGPDGPRLTLRYQSEDGEENYPGTLSVTAVYTWTHGHELRLLFTATTDRETLCNLTNHSYFNLAGAGKATILDHEIRIEADRFTPINDVLIPIGDLAPVAGSALDFTASRRIGDRIEEDHPQIAFGGGYDHNFVLNKTDGSLDLAAVVWDPDSGRTLEVRTTAPGVQFYSGNFLSGAIPGKEGLDYPYRSGFCLEPQVFPNAVNQPGFPSPWLAPGDTYRHEIVYAFGSDA